MLRKGWDYNMNQNLKKFLIRGVAFSGLGPIVAGFVYMMLDISGVIVEVNGFDFFKAVVTSYIMAFVHAGSTIFPQIDSWSKPKAMGLMFLCLFTVYTIGYLINGWIPFSWTVIAIYTTCFVVGYLVIWTVAFFSSRTLSKRLNEKLNAKLEESK